MTDTAKKTPLQRVTELHGGKEKLVDKLMGLLDRGDESKDEFRRRLLAAPNSKLLRLFDVNTEIKDKFGNKEKLVDVILAQLGRAKDSDYRDRLLTFSPTRLFDLHKASLKPKKPRKKSKKGKKKPKAA